MGRKLNYLGYLYDFTVGNNFDGEVFPTLIEIAENGFSEKIYSGKLYQKVIDMGYHLDDPVDEMFRDEEDPFVLNIIKSMEMLLYDISRLLCEYKKYCEEHDLVEEAFSQIEFPQTASS